jgi:hypothetical protein
MDDVAVVFPGDVCAFISEGYSRNVGAHTCATGDVPGRVRAFCEVAETGHGDEADRGELVTSYDVAHVSHAQGHSHVSIRTDRDAVRECCSTDCGVTDRRSVCDDIARARSEDRVGCALACTAPSYVDQNKRT